jgi:hypothetical protein
MAVVTGWLMSVMGVSQEPTRLTIGRRLSAVSKKRLSRGVRGPVP